MTTFDAAATFKRLQRQARARRKRRTAIEVHEPDILALRQEGASLDMICMWLRTDRRITVSRSTLWRFLRQSTARGIDAH